MNKLEDIFKTNPSLLEEPEVKELIKYCMEVHDKNMKLTIRYKEFFDNVLEAVVYSDQMLINGTPDKVTVDKILQLTDKF